VHAGTLTVYGNIPTTGTIAGAIDGTLVYGTS
jgi:hypothetical protein